MKSLQHLAPFSSLQTNPLYECDLVFSDDSETKAFDSSFLNVLKLTGTDRLKYMQGQSTNQLNPLKQNDGITTLVGNTKAKIISRVELFVGNDCLYLLHQASTTEALMAQLDMFIIVEDVQMELLTDLYSISYSSESVFSSLFDDGYGFLENENGLIFKWTGFGNETITHCFTESNLPDVAKLSFLNAKELEAIRILNFYPIANQEFGLNDKLMAELEHNEYISFSKGCFLGYEILARIKNRGHTNKTLSLIEFTESFETSPVGQKIFMQETSKGTATSYVESNEKFYVLGYVPTLLKEIGKTVELEGLTGTILK